MRGNILLDYSGLNWLVIAFIESSVMMDKIRDSQGGGGIAKIPP